jgi:hypothetical protein
MERRKASQHPRVVIAAHLFPGAVRGCGGSKFLLGARSSRQRGGCRDASIVACDRGALGEEQVRQIWNRECYNLIRVASLAALAVLVFGGVALAQNVGTVTEVKGTAQIQRAGATLPVATGTALMLHDKIVTGADSEVLVSIVDQSKLTIGPSTTMTIDDSALVDGQPAPTKVGLVKGTLRSLILGELRSAAGGFEIHTPNAIGAVRGTDVTITVSETPPPTK